MSAPDPQPTPPRSVFVYGTLMPGERNAWVAHTAAPPVRAERARLSGYTLYDLRPEGYPALIENTSEAAVEGWVLHYGEGWEAALPHLDDLEGLHLTPPLYHRQQATAETESGPQTVWVYVYARLDRLQTSGAVVVASGRWTDTADREFDTGWPGVGEG
ncbi:gamma-glutamylcyclotransferase [Deinococcus sp. KNUC1210]|uniref:gamma-glutamylcyclotransferase family protein n=1 Tax=Deinococcus sp. KNUC1210 TaxID=2917691 RepID=UPI001EF0A0FA|nr:gamma-glutamylcyclotransferase family protein [Deinococcus sp. KNUC1210]ULH14583.1 gamma-glutamylcyclotransferase [Deinococcus sp. KNUC1210]